ncbi:MAG: type II toxin-antitoxin system RelE/ParE family toxin [Crocinitomicaceae bacterium]
MDYKVIVSSLFEKDLEQAIIWYIEINPELAKEFLKEFNTARKYLSKHPEKIQIRYGKTRIAFFKKFPFGIHFTLEQKTIYIIALFHTSLNPKNWR